MAQDPEDGRPGSITGEFMELLAFGLLMLVILDGGVKLGD